MPAGPQPADRGPCHFCELFGRSGQEGEKGPVRPGGLARERFYILFHGFWRICRYVSISVFWRIRRYISISVHRSVYGYLDISIYQRMDDMSIYRYIDMSIYWCIGICRLDLSIHRLIQGIGRYVDMSIYLSYVNMSVYRHIGISVY